MNLLNVLKTYFRKNPHDPAVEGLLKYLPELKLNGAGLARKKIVVQAVQDPYYVSVFSAILSEMSKRVLVDSERVVFRSVESAIGTGVREFVKRSFPFNWLISRQWNALYKKVAPKIAYRSVSWRHPILDSVALIGSIVKWKKIKDFGDLESLEIQGIKCGDLIIDTYLRFFPDVTVDLNDRFLCYLIWQAHRDVLRAKRYFSKKRPDLFLSSYATYIQHGVPVRVAVKLGIKVVTFGNFQEIGKTLSGADYFQTKNSGNYRSRFNEKLDKERLLEVSRACLDNRLSGGVDPVTAYMAVSAYACKKKECPDMTGVVVVYLHDFFDSPHIYRNMLFPDFWAWICFTIDTLRANKIRFKLKRHPNQVNLSEGAVGLLLKMYQDLEFVPDGVTTRQLVDAGMVCVITVFGTISHEVAYLGVPSIAACAGNPHAEFGFCYTANTIFEYEVLLGKANQLRLVDRDAAKREVLEFFSIHNFDLTPEEIEARDIMIKMWSECHRTDRDGKKIGEMAIALSRHSGFCAFVTELID